jgi:hypothetical protein
MNKLAKVQGIDAWNAATEHQMYALLWMWDEWAYWQGMAGSRDWGSLYVARVARNIAPVKMVNEVTNDADQRRN